MSVHTIVLGLVIAQFVGFMLILGGAAIWTALPDWRAAAAQRRARPSAPRLTASSDGVQGTRTSLN